MYKKTSKNKKHQATIVTRVVIVTSCLGCILLFSLGRVKLFGPPEKKLPITENVAPNLSLNMNLVYQSNETVPYAYEIVVEGTRAYLLANDGESIYTLNISNPESPVVDNIYRPLDFYARNITAHGNYLYIDTGVLEVLDVTNTNNPEPIWQFDTEGLILNIAFSIDHIYVTDSQSNLYIINNIDPGHPKLVKRLAEFNNLDYIRYAEASNNQLFIAENGLYIFDITDPTNPIEVGFYGLPFGIDYFDGIVVSDQTIWVRGEYRDIFGDSQGHILLLDLSKPSVPRLISTYDHYPFALSGNIICFYDTSTSNESIHLMDFSNPNKPIELGYMGGAYSSLGYPSALTIKNNDIYIYSGNFDDGINIIKYSPR